MRAARRGRRAYRRIEGTRARVRAASMTALRAAAVPAVARILGPRPAAPGDDAFVAPGAAAGQRSPGDDCVCCMAFMCGDASSSTPHMGQSLFGSR